MEKGSKILIRVELASNVNNRSPNRKMRAANELVQMITSRKKNEGEKAKRKKEIENEKIKMKRRKVVAKF